MDLMEIIASLRPKIGDMSDEEREQVFAMVWQQGILSQQFHDITKCMMYWSRHPEKRQILKEEAITHLADCWCQLEVVARLFGLTDRQLAEALVLSKERLKDHYVHEIAPLTKEKVEDKNEYNCERSRNLYMRHVLGQVITLYELDNASAHINGCELCREWRDKTFTTHKIY